MGPITDLVALEQQDVNYPCMRDLSHSGLHGDGIDKMRFTEQSTLAETVVKDLSRQRAGMCVNN